MPRQRRSSRPDLVRLAPWALGSGGLALGFVALQLLGPQAHLPSAAQAAGMLLAIVAAGLAWRWRRRVAAPPALSKDRREFEARLGEAFRSQGYLVVPAGTGGPVDMVLRRDRGTYLVHHRQWQADKLGIEAVQDLQAVIATRSADGGFVICQGRFSRESQRCADGSSLKLIDGPALAQLLAR